MSSRISSTTFAIEPLEQRELDVVRQPAQVQLLPKTNGAERIDAGAVRLSLAQQGQAGAAAADLRQQRPLAAERRRGPSVCRTARNSSRLSSASSMISNAMPVRA